MKKNAIDRCKEKITQKKTILCGESFSIQFEGHR